MLSGCQNLNRLSWSPRKIMVKDLRQRSGLAWFCACAESCVVFNTGLYTDLPDNSILITANMQSETGFPSSHQLKSYVAFKSRLKLAARAVLSADAGLLVLIAMWSEAKCTTGASSCRIKVCSHLRNWSELNWTSQLSSVQFTSALRRQYERVFTADYYDDARPSGVSSSQKVWQ